MLLSCCIISHNEGDRIERCIRAARGIVDDIVVVDFGSSDDTVSKAQSLGARVIFSAWDGYGPQKRVAEDRALHDWIRNLDADEVITDELAGEIAALMRMRVPPLPAYWFRQVTVYPGKDKPRLWADYHNYVRLYDRRRVRFRESRVHDTVDRVITRSGSFTAWPCTIPGARWITFVETCQLYRSAGERTQEATLGNPGAVAV